MSAMPQPLVEWFAMTTGEKAEVCEKALRGVSSDREELAQQVVLDRVATKVEREGETAGLLADLYEARHGLDYMASRVDLPYYHAKPFRELLTRVRWLERAVEAES